MPCFETIDSTVGFRRILIKKPPWGMIGKRPTRSANLGEVRIIRRRGVRETSRWVSSAGIARVVRTMATEATRDPVHLSTPLVGEHGFEGVSLSSSVPVTIDTDGVAEIHEWELSATEHEQLEAAYEAIRADIEEFDRSARWFAAVGRNRSILSRGN